MRNGNSIFSKLSTSSTSSVLILPMRNGNLFSSNISEIFFIVLILPMRNGNGISIPVVSVKILVSFLSYLWGMETTRRHLNSQKLVVFPFLVLILPMRNGNFPLSALVLFFLLVLILPMRNGNRNKSPKVTLLSIATVLILPMRNGNLTHSGIYCTSLPGSYPTYEEWKLFIKCDPDERRLVLILPMRNGNNISISSCFTVYTSFLSYLWGMETMIPYLTQQATFDSSYPTYEE